MSPSSLPRHTSAACHALHAKRSIVGNGMSLGACVCAVVPLNHGLSKTDPKLTWHRHTWPWQNYIRIRNIGKGDSCRHILTWIPSWGPSVGQWVVKLLDSMYRLHSNFTYQQPTKPTRYSSPKTKTKTLFLQLSFLILFVWLCHYRKPKSYSQIAFTRSSPRWRRQDLLLHQAGMTPNVFRPSVCLGQGSGLCAFSAAMEIS